MRLTCFLWVSASTNYRYGTKLCRTTDSQPGAGEARP